MPTIAAAEVLSAKLAQPGLGAGDHDQPMPREGDAYRLQPTDYSGAIGLPPFCERRRRREPIMAVRRTGVDVQFGVHTRPKQVERVQDALVAEDVEIADLDVRRSKAAEVF